MTDLYTPGPMMGAFDGALPMAMPEPPPEKRFDCKIKRCIKSGRLLVDIVPLEDFEMDASATRLDEDSVTFAGDKTRITRGKLKLRYPDKKDIIDELPVYTEAVDQGLQKQSRDNDRWGLRTSPQDPDSEIVEIRESYLLVDYDGDGIQEWRQIVTGGIIGQRHILSNEEWGGLLPYTDICPNPQPHRWRGRSLFEDLYDIQRIKTVLLRQTMDNLYLTNNPRQVASDTNILNKEAVVMQGLADTIWAKGDVNAALATTVTPFVAKDTFPVLEYWDMVAAKRTGVSRESMGLDKDAMQNQTATAVQAQQSAQYTKIEAFARNIAECGGLKRLFKCLLQLYCENQRRSRTIRLRGKWVQIDPRAWDANMDVTINVGLGAGSKDRDLAMLQGVLMLQKEVIMGLQDPYNPILNVGHVLETGRKLTEISGLKQPEQYFPELTQDRVAQIREQMAQNPPPNPDMIKAQAQMQIEGVKAQNAMQIKQQELVSAEKQSVMDFEREKQNDERKAQIEQVQMQADIVTNERKVAADIQIAREKFELEKQLTILEHQAKMQEMAAQSQARAEQSQAKIEETKAKAKNPKASVAVKHDAEQLTGPLAEMLKQFQEGTQASNAQAMQALADAIAKSNAPKRVVRDPKSGRVSHIETVG